MSRSQWLQYAVVVGYSVTRRRVPERSVGLALPAVSCPRIPPSLCKVLRDARPNLVPDASEYSELLGAGTRSLRQVLKRPMEHLFRTRERRAGLLRAVTDSYHNIEVRSRELINVFARLFANVNSEIGHGIDRKWMNVPGRIGAGGKCLPPITAKLPPKGLGHLAATRVAGAQD